MFFLSFGFFKLTFHYESLLYTLHCSQHTKLKICKFDDSYKVCSLYSSYTTVQIEEASNLQSLIYKGNVRFQDPFYTRSACQSECSAPSAEARKIWPFCLKLSFWMQELTHWREIDWGSSISQSRYAFCIQLNDSLNQLYEIITINTLWGAKINLPSNIYYFLTLCMSGLHLSVVECPFDSHAIW